MYKMLREYKEKALGLGVRSWPWRWARQTRILGQDGRGISGAQRAVNGARAQGELGAAGPPLNRQHTVCLRGRQGQVRDRPETH